MWEESPLGVDFSPRCFPKVQPLGVNNTQKEMTTVVKSTTQMRSVVPPPPKFVSFVPGGAKQRTPQDQYPPFVTKKKFWGVYNDPKGHET